MAEGKTETAMRLAFPAILLIQLLGAGGFGKNSDGTITEWQDPTRCIEIDGAAGEVLREWTMPAGETCK